MLIGKDRSHGSIVRSGHREQTFSISAVTAFSTRKLNMTTTIAGIRIPDSTLARATTEYIRDIESDLLYHHSRRVFLFGALSGERKQLA